jgi:hypothetical protein
VADDRANPNPGALTDALQDIKRTGQGILGLPGALAGGLINPIRKPFQESGLGNAIARGYAAGRGGPQGLASMMNAQTNQSNSRFMQQRYDDDMTRQEDERNRQILAEEAEKIRRQKLATDINNYFNPKGGPDPSDPNDYTAMMSLLEKHGKGEEMLTVWKGILENDQKKSSTDKNAQTEWHSLQTPDGFVYQQLMQRMPGSEPATWEPSLRTDGTEVLKIPAVSVTQSLPSSFLEQITNERIEKVHAAQGPDMAIAVGNNAAYIDPLFSDTFVYGTGPDRRKQVEKLDYALSLRQLNNAAIRVGEEFGQTAAWTDVTENLNKLFTGTGNPAAQNYIARRAMAMARKVKSLSGAQYSEKELRFYYDVFPTLKELIRYEDHQPYGLSAAATYKLNSESDSVFAAYTTPFQPETIPTRERWKEQLTKRAPLSNMRVETGKALPTPSPTDFLQAAWATRESFAVDNVHYDGAGYGKEDDVSPEIFMDVMQTVLVNQGFNPAEVVSMIGETPEQTEQIFITAVRNMNNERKRMSDETGVDLPPISAADALAVIGISTDAN